MSDQLELPPHFITPLTDEGPLRPPVAIPHRADFTSEGKAVGPQIIFMGTISNHRKKPVTGALVEIWQADNNGYYDHPRARGDEALDDYWKITKSDLDPNFLYFGAVETNSDGVFWFRTIIPRWYHVFGTDRASHIHVKYQHADSGVMTTEVYFPRDEDESRRQNDRVFDTRQQQPDIIVNFVSPESRLPGVPLIDGVQYCRKDVAFL